VSDAGVRLLPFLLTQDDAFAPLTDSGPACIERLPLPVLLPPQLLLPALVELVVVVQSPARPLSQGGRGLASGWLRALLAGAARETVHVEGVVG